MATGPIEQAGKIVTLPGIIPPMPAVARVLARFDRDKIASAIEVMIALLDMYDGDTDMEDASDLEDDFALSPVALLNAANGPGCLKSDSDCCNAGDDKIASSWDSRPGDPDDREVATAEWHTLPSIARCAGKIDGRPIDPRRRYVPEDAEDDDPDCCPAGDDRIASGVSPGCMDDHGPGEPDDGF